MEEKSSEKRATDPSKLAETMLRLLINCLHGGPKFFLSLIPVAKLNPLWIKLFSSSFFGT